MHSISTNLERFSQKTGVVVLFNPALRAKKQPQPCIFCGKTIHIQSFKGKTVCYACLQQVPALFVCS